MTTPHIKLVLHDFTATVAEGAVPPALDCVVSISGFVPVADVLGRLCSRPWC